MEGLKNPAFLIALVVMWTACKTTESVGEREAKAPDEPMGQGATVELFDELAALYKRGKELSIRGENERAIRSLRQVIEAGESDYFYAAHMELGLILYSLQELEEAHQHFAVVAEGAELVLSARALKMKGNVAMLTGASQQALNYLADAIGRTEKFKEELEVARLRRDILGHAAVVLGWRGGPAEGIAWIAEHVQGLEKVQALEFLGDEYMQAMSYGEARAVFTALLEIAGEEAGLRAGQKLDYYVHLAWIQRLQSADERDDAALQGLLDYVEYLSSQEEPIEPRDQTEELIIKVAEKALGDGLSAVEKRSRLRRLEILLKSHRQWYGTGETKEEAIRLLGTVLVELGEYEEARQILEPQCGRGYRSACQVLERFMRLD